MFYNVWLDQLSHHHWTLVIFPFVLPLLLSSDFLVLAMYPHYYEHPHYFAQLRCFGQPPYFGQPRYPVRKYLPQVKLFDSLPIYVHRCIENEEFTPRSSSFGSSSHASYFPSIQILYPRRIQFKELLPCLFHQIQMQFLSTPRSTRSMHSLRLCSFTPWVSIDKLLELLSALRLLC